MAKEGIPETIDTALNMTTWTASELSTHLGGMCHVATVCGVPPRSPRSKLVYQPHEDYNSTAGHK